MWLKRISLAWAKVEMSIAAVLAAAVTGLILTNVVTRSLDRAIFWIDEAAIYAMIWMTFLAASAAIAHRDSVSVTILKEFSARPIARAMDWFVDGIVLLFTVLMCWFVWRWFNPAGLIAAGFDVMAFQGTTFNFIYSEPTTTLGLPKALIWSVMILFSLGAFLHAVANLFERLTGGGEIVVTSATGDAQ